MQRIGVFVCWCGSNIAGTVDVKAVAEALEKEKQLVPVESGMLDSIFSFMSDIASSVESTDLMLTGTTNL